MILKDEDDDNHMEVVSTVFGHVPPVFDGHGRKHDRQQQYGGNRETGKLVVLLGPTLPTSNDEDNMRKL